MFTLAKHWIFTFSGVLKVNILAVAVAIVVVVVVIAVLVVLLENLDILGLENAWSFHSKRIES